MIVLRFAGERNRYHFATHPIHLGHYPNAALSSKILTLLFQSVVPFPAVNLICWEH